MVPFTFSPASCSFLSRFHANSSNVSKTSEISEMGNGKRVSLQRKYVTYFVSTRDKCIIRDLPLPHGSIR